MKFKYSKYVPSLSTSSTWTSSCRSCPICCSRAGSATRGDPCGRRRSHDAGAARRDSRGAVQRRRAAAGRAREAVRRSGGRRSGADAPAARGADPADHRADAGVGLHHAVARISRPSGSAAPQGGGPGEGEPQQVQFEVTDKALDFLGFKALRDLLGSLGHSSAGPPRHARSVDRHRGQRRAEALRVRRHDEPRRHRHHPQRRPAHAEAAGPTQARTGPASTSPTRT